MRKFILLLTALVFLGCSSEDAEGEEQAMCCQHTEAEIIEIFHNLYQPMLEEENLSEEQRNSITKVYEQSLADPCTYFKKYLESSGATCENPF